MYANVGDLAKAYGSTELVEKLRDEQPLFTEAMLADYLANALPDAYTVAELAVIAAAVERINASLESQSIFMDSFFAKRYTLPLSNTVIGQSPVKKCCLVLARADLSDDANNMSEGMTEERDYWRKWLEQVGKGNAVLVGGESTEVRVGEVDRTYKTAQPSSKIDWDNYP